MAAFVELFFLLFFIAMILGTAFWIWMLIDSITNKNLGDSQRVLWIVLIVFTHFLGALLYFFIGRKQQPQFQYYQPYQQGPGTYQQQGPAASPPYQQGYRPAQPPYQAGSQEGRQEPYANNIPPAQPPYERPQASYPENRSE